MNNTAADQMSTVSGKYTTLPKLLNLVDECTDRCLSKAMRRNEREIDELLLKMLIQSKYKHYASHHPENQDSKETENEDIDLEILFEKITSTKYRKNPPLEPINCNSEKNNINNRSSSLTPQIFEFRNIAHEKYQEKRKKKRKRKQKKHQSTVRKSSVSSTDGVGNNNQNNNDNTNSTKNIGIGDISDNCLQLILTFLSPSVIHALASDGYKFRTPKFTSLHSLSKRFNTLITRNYNSNLIHYTTIPQCISGGWFFTLDEFYRFMRQSNAVCSNYGEQVQFQFPNGLISFGYVKEFPWPMLVISMGFRFFLT